MKNKKLNKRTILIVLSMALMLCLTACASSEISKIKDKINSVEVSAYMEEEQDAVKELKENYLADLDKVKEEKEAKKLLQNFRADLAAFATREDKVKTYKELVEKQLAKLDAKKKEEAEKVLQSFADKLSDVTSNKDFDMLTTEINKKISSIVGTTVTVTSTEVETSTLAAKKVSQQASSGSTSSGSSNKGSNSSGGSNPSKPSTPSKPSHSHSWTPHYATGYRTETYYETVIKCHQCGMIFNSSVVASDHIENNAGVCGSWGHCDVPRTEQVPYSYVDYYYCSCGATK